MDWLGLETRDGRYQADDPPPAPPYNNLAQLNDKGKSFGEIADIIEREPKGLLGPTADPWFTELQS